MSLSHHPSIVKNGLVAYFDAANVKSYPAGQDPYVSGVNLLFDGESLVDKSAKTQSFTNNGTVAVSATQKKFGNSSLYFSGRTADGGSNSYLSFAANSDFGFSSGDWTVETWFYKTTPLASLDVLFDNRVGAGGNVSGVALYVQAGVVKTGNDAERLAGATIATGVWNHLMISRSGNNIYLGVNGTVVSAAFSTTLHSAPQLYVGNSVIGEYAGGYMDDYRVTKGFARYTVNYTVPTGPNALTGTVTDLTKNKINSTLIAGPTYSSTNGGSLLFDGGTQYINIGSNSNLILGTNNFALELWFKPVSRAQGYPFLLHNQIGGSSFTTNCWQINDRHGNNPTLATFWCYNYNTGSSAMLASASAISNGNWYHLVITRIGNVFSMYLNSVLQSTVTSSISVDGGASMNYGFNTTGAGGFNGNSSIIKVYKDKGLTSTEVLQNYNATKSRYGY